MGESGSEAGRIPQQTIYRAMGHSGHLCVMASEESEGIIPIPDEGKRGRYVLMFDPLDGSSNIDVNASIGTIFSIHRQITTGTADGLLEDCLQKGDAANRGRLLHLRIEHDDGVHHRARRQRIHSRPSLGEFLLSHENIRHSQTGRSTASTKATLNQWDTEPAATSITSRGTCKADGRPYSARYIGSSWRTSIAIC